MKKQIKIIIILSMIAIFIIGMIIGSFIINKKEANKLVEEIKQPEPEVVEEKYVYDCSFTQSFRIIELMDDYASNDGVHNYVVVDRAQEHIPMTALVNETDKSTLKEVKFYNFTYTIKGTSSTVLDDINKIINSIDQEIDNGKDKYKITLEITESDPTQRSENICKYSKIIKEAH